MSRISKADQNRIEIKIRRWATAHAARINARVHSVTRRKTFWLVTFSVGGAYWPMMLDRDGNRI